MRIAYICSYIPSERNTTPYQRARFLRENHELFLFIRKNANVPTCIKSNVKVFESPIELPYIRAIIFIFWAVYKVLLLNKLFHFNAVYSFYNHTSIAGYLLKLFGFKWIVDIWDVPDLLLERKKRTLKTDFQYFMKYCFVYPQVFIVKKVLKFSDLVICALLPEALNYYKIPKKKIFYITNGIDLDITRPKGEKRCGNNFIILYVGYAMQNRGLNTMMLAMKRVIQTIPRSKLILVGPTDDKKLVLKRLSDLNYNNIEYWGVVDHRKVLSLIETSDVCVHPFPRKKELDCIYPIKIFEYLAMGKAVVASNLLGVRTIIKDEENGLLFEPDNPDDLALAILRIYNDQEIRRRLEENARDSVKKYDWKIINKKINEKINKLINRDIKI